MCVALACCFLSCFTFKIQVQQTATFLLGVGTQPSILFVITKMYKKNQTINELIAAYDPEFWALHFYWSHISQHVFFNAQVSK